ncbi:MAG: type II secretion system protein [Epsilonproteobacteria bacterium]|nr:type II secretion system protein [Campylobacterota bacterium]
MKNAFTMIELIFVIVILGILGAVAIPKLSGIKDDAQIANTNENFCVNLKGNYMAYSVRHEGSLVDFNLSKFFDFSDSIWYSQASGNLVTPATSIVTFSRGLIPFDDTSGTITPFASIPENSLYLYLLDGNMSADKPYGCFVGSKPSYSKTASELRTMMNNGTNYL